MQQDDIIWDTIMYKNECTFRKRTITRNFCKNPYNLTGLCTRKACPLANSQYCTVREDKGKYLEGSLTSCTRGLLDNDAFCDPARDSFHGVPTLCGGGFSRCVVR